MTRTGAFVWRVTVEHLSGEAMAERQKPLEKKRHDRLFATVKTERLILTACPWGSDLATGAREVILGKDADAYDWQMVLHGAECVGWAQGTEPIGEGHDEPA